MDVIELLWGTGPNELGWVERALAALDGVELCLERQ